MAGHNWKITVLWGTVSVFLSAIKRAEKSPVDTPPSSNIWSINRKVNCLVYEAKPHFVFQTEPVLYSQVIKKNISETLSKLGVLTRLKDSHDPSICIVRCGD